MKPTYRLPVKSPQQVTAYEDSDSYIAAICVPGTKYKPSTAHNVSWTTPSDFGPRSRVIGPMVVLLKSARQYNDRNIQATGYRTASFKGWLFGHFGTDGQTDWQIQDDSKHRVGIALSGKMHSETLVLYFFTFLLQSKYTIIMCYRMALFAWS